MICISRCGVARTSLRALTSAAVLCAAGVVLAMAQPTSSTVSTDNTNLTANSQALSALLDRESRAEVDPLAIDDAEECEPAWVQTFGGQQGTNGGVRALTVFDDGSGDGPALYVGGAFTTAGGIETNHIAKWDGTFWSPLGTGMNGTVRALTVYDDGSGDGPALYAGGEFTVAGDEEARYIAKWDGTSWSPLGTGMNSRVYAFTVFDDGSGGGPAMYAGGAFTSAGGVSANRIAKWDGISWSPLGMGMDSAVFALTEFDDGSGSGPALYAGGNFTFSGGVDTNRIAKWDGTSWSALSTGMNFKVFALAAFDDRSGNGPALYAGGGFSTAGGVSAYRIAKWDGSTWSPLGAGMDTGVDTLTVFDDGLGGGPALYAGGEFITASGETVNRIAKWDGSAWSPLSTGISNSNARVYALTVFDDGSNGGPALYAGGFFSIVSGVGASRIVKWDGTSWSPLTKRLNQAVEALTEFDDGSGSGPALYVGGRFTSAGGESVNRIGKWDGTSWSPLGTGVSSNLHTSTVYALAVFDDGLGGGPALYAGGFFTSAGGASANNIAKWDGTSWSPLGAGMNSVVLTLIVFDDGTGGGPALYAGGDFTNAGGVEANRIAKWDGTSWSPLGAGLNNLNNTLAVFDDGTGPALYVGGTFTTAGGVETNRIARWDGISWEPLGTGMNNSVNALTVFVDRLGSGPALYAGGSFTTAGGVSANRIAKWDGTSWSPLLGFGLSPSVSALTVFDDGSGSGPELYAGGQFTSAGANRIAKWDGESWSPLDAGMSSVVRALNVFDDGSGNGPALFAGGQFTASPAGDSYLAKWQGCPVEPPCATADLNCDGVVNVSDLLILLSHWGPCIPKEGSCEADLNGDGTVNVSDLLLLLAQWG
jgi:hypothetical protein